MTFFNEVKITKFTYYIFSYLKTSTELNLLSTRTDQIQRLRLCCEQEWLDTIPIDKMASLLAKSPKETPNTLCNFSSDTFYTHSRHAMAEIIFKHCHRKGKKKNIQYSLCRHLRFFFKEKTKIIKIHLL